MSDEEKFARWCVQLNCWVWPPDLPGKPNPPGGMTAEQERYALRGAFAVVNQIADMALVDELWRDKEKRQALLGVEDTNTTEQETTS